MRGVLIDDDERVLGCGDDEGVVDLRARRAERIGGAWSLIRSDAPAGIGARLSERRKRCLSPLGEAEGMRAEPSGARAASGRRRHAFRCSAGDA